MNPSQMSEAFVADEVDRIIGSANIRIEQQRIHIEEFFGQSAAGDVREGRARANGRGPRQAQALSGKVYLGPALDVDQLALLNRCHVTVTLPPTDARG